MNSIKNFYLIDLAYGVLIFGSVAAVGIYGFNLSTILFTAGVAAGFALRVLERIWTFQTIIARQAEHAVEEEIEEQVPGEVEREVTDQSDTLIKDEVEDQIAAKDEIDNERN